VLVLVMVRVVRAPSRKLNHPGEGQFAPQAKFNWKSEGTYSMIKNTPTPAPAFSA
jgi:hypothetical protein